MSDDFISPPLARALYQVFEENVHVGSFDDICIGLAEAREELQIRGRMPADHVIGSALIGLIIRDGLRRSSGGWEATGEGLHILERIALKL